MFQNCKYKWNYQATKEKQDAYENLISNFYMPSPQEFILLSLGQKKNIIKDFIKQIRKINVFPVYYFNEEGIKKEILSVVNKQNISFDENDNLNIQASQGCVLLDFLFPNLHHIHAGQRTKPSMYEVFYDDEKLFQCLLYFLQRRKMNTLRTAFFCSSRYLWNAGTNFSPIRAKTIYERFCPKNGVIYDYSAGYGGRMLGALSSKNNYKYIAVEPNSDTYYNLLQLGQLINKTTNKQNFFEIYQQGSEIFVPNQQIDLAFSCPPFFNLQTYSEEPTQSIIKFPSYNDWLKFYVKPTIQNCYDSLKKDGVYAVDLMNFKNSRKKTYLIQDWIQAAQSQNFILRQICENHTRNRKQNVFDREKILIFTKQEKVKISLADINPDLIEKYNKRFEQIEEEKNKKLKKFCLYDIFGHLLNTFSSLSALEKQCGYSQQIIKKHLNKKRYNQFYFRSYEKDEPILNIIEIKPVICKIDGIYYDSYAEVGRLLGTSRQAVQQANKRKSKKVMNKNIQWIE